MPEPDGARRAGTADVVLRLASARLARAGVASAAADARTLLGHAWGRDGGRVMHAQIMREPLPAPVAVDFAALVAARERRAPLQHLTGVAPFRGIELRVGPGVFVPRPETELLVDLVLTAARGMAAPVVVDLCTGSGAIALAVKHELPAARVSAVELSPPAHAWAARNRDLLGLDVDLRLGDATNAFADLAGRVDVVVSNPPYIPDRMVPVDPEVRDHDPAVALYGGSEDGLRIPLAVARRAARLLRPGGTLVMEHADSQGDSLPAALRAMTLPADATAPPPRAWTQVRDVADLAGRPRHTLAIRA